MQDVLEAYDLRRRNELKERASMDYVLADLILVGTAKVMDADIEYPTIYEAYPALFEEEYKAQEEEKIRKEQERYKAQWLAFAAHVNSTKR